jgi:hypothetical protein
MFSQTAVGDCLSSTVTVKVQVDTLPEASVAVWVTEVVPTANVAPLAGPAVRAIVTAEQLSLADGMLYVTSALHKSTSVFTVMLAGHTITGGVVSVTVSTCTQVAVLPEASVTV